MTEKKTTAAKKKKKTTGVKEKKKTTGVKEKKKTTAAKKKRKTKIENTIANQAQRWTESMRKSKGPLLDYGIDKHFKPGDKISHSSFGSGLVDRLSSSGKIWVIFESGEKLLIHDRTVK